MVARLPPLAHIDLARVAIGFCQARRRVSHGLQASLTPMRFEGGERTTLRRGQRFAAQQLLDEQGSEILYILNFYLPRFLDQTFDQKLITILHELWHISPNFDGDVRRHPGRCYVHTHSEQEYDEAMAKLANQWLAQEPPPSLYEFLKHSFDTLSAQHGRVYGAKYRAPKLIPL